MRIRRAFQMAVIGAIAACAPYEPGPVATTLTPQSEGRIFFETQDVYDLSEVVAGTAKLRTIHGDLTLPPGTGEVRGAIILSHGSTGVGGLHRRYAERFLEMGLAVFLMDHFTPRSVGSTARDQLRVTAQGMLVDVVAAQKLLASHPRIPADKIAHIGWSKGGIVALSAAFERLAGFAGQDLPFAFTTAFYPFCGFAMEGEALAAPLLILTGAEDNWTPSAPCKRLAAGMAGRGQPIEIEVYPDAHHGFDSRSIGFEAAGVVTVRDDRLACQLNVDAKGQTGTTDGAHQLSTPAGRIGYLRACGTRGVRYEGNAKARDASWARLVSFVDRHLPR